MAVVRIGTRSDLKYMQRMNQQGVYLVDPKSDGEILPISIRKVKAVQVKQAYRRWPKEQEI